MHIVGMWRNSGVGDSDAAPEMISLECSDFVTVIENDDVKVCYQGVIFDLSESELLNNQTALDNAYGLFTYIKVLKKTNEVIIGTDKLGFSPLYYSRQKNAVHFSTSLTVLKYRLGEITPNYEAWEELLNLSTILGDKTTVKEISRLGYGYRIHISRDKINFKRFWSPEIPEQCGSERFIERNNDLLIEALEKTRSYPNSKIVLMSGGEDSRRLGITANSINLPVTFATQEVGLSFGADENVAIAQEVAKCLSVPFIRVPLPDKEEYYNNWLKRDFWCGFETHYHNWSFPLARNIPTNSLIYDGMAGDVAINGHWARIYPNRYRGNDIDKIAQNITRENYVFKFDKSRVDISLFERVREQLQLLPDCPARMDYFCLLNRARRNISISAQIYSLEGHKTCYPFLYYPLFMQSLSLNPIEKTKIYYQRECMKKLNSKAAAIPTTRDNLTSEYLIDRVAQHKEMQEFFSRNCNINPVVARLFPELRRRIRISKLLSWTRIYAFDRRSQWLLMPLYRLSNFLEWIDDNNAPEFPINIDQPGYLVDRTVSKL